MARVTIETHAIADNRFTNLMDDLKCRKAEAIGLLTLFWHDSQNRGVWEGTKEQILKFIPGRGEEAEKIFEALKLNEYVVETDEAGVFEIKGNKKHIQALRKWGEAKKRAGQLGGKKSGEVRKKQSLIERSKTKQNEAPDEAEREAAKLNAMQSNAMQDNAVQLNACQSSSIQKNTLAESCEEQEQMDLCSTQRANASLRGCIAELCGNPSVSEILLQVTQETQKSWLKAYPSADWIKQEVLLANVWMTANPQKRPKQMARFLSNWFNRAFESYRKGIPSRRMTNSELNQQAIGDLYRKVESEAG